MSEVIASPYAQPIFDPQSRIKLSTIRVVGMTLARAAAFLSLLSLIGWNSDIPALRNLGQAVSMNPLTALLFLLCWLAIELLPRDPNRAAKIPQAIGVLITAVSILKILSYFGLQFPLDRLIFKELLDSETLPNQMAPNTSIAFLLLGIKLILLCTRPRLSTSLPQVLALFTGYIGFQSLIAYFFGLGGSFEFGGIVPMALNTALALLAVSISLLLLDSDRGFVAELTRDLAGGRMASRLLPAAILVPIGIGWLRFKGQKHQLFADETGVTLMITAMVISLVAAIWWYARHLNRADARTHEILSDLANLNMELESFSYSVSHDLRAPLRSIAGFSHILREEHAEALNQEARDHLQRISNASERMGKLIDGLLGLSRLSRKQIRYVPVDLTQLATTTINDLSVADPGRIVTVELQPQLMAMGDPDLLAIVIQNLISNAWKFTSRKVDARIEFGSTYTASGRQYFVRDNGAGFDPEHAGNLFGAFQRLHPMSEFEGTGIGLATVQRIIHRHNGKIWAEAQPDQGATFYFTLRSPAQLERN